MMLVYQKNTDLQGEGGLKIRTHEDKGEGGNGQKFAVVFYVWPLIQCILLSNAKTC